MEENLSILRRKLNQVANYFNTDEMTMLDFLETFTNEELVNYADRGLDGFEEMKKIFKDFKENKDATNNKN